MPRRAERPRRVALAALILAGIALPALAQQKTPESILPPGFGDPTPPAPPPAAGQAQPAPAPSPGSAPLPAATSSVPGKARDMLAELDAAADRPPPPPPPEYPAGAQREWDQAGVFAPEDLGLGAAPWGSANGKFLASLMRRMDTPIASRWAQIALRSALLSSGPAPWGIHPGDWAAERAWLLLRLGEADSARMLVAGIDTDRFTPRLTQVAAQVALATSDPSGLCPIEKRLARVEPAFAPLVAAMCASLAGEAERAAADIEAARRRGRIGGIDLGLADKLVGAGADTARAVTIEWEPVERLTSWRYGLATASGMMPPDKLVEGAAPRVRAWLARSPIFPASQRLAAARTAAALGVMSSEAAVELYAAAFDSTDPDLLGESDAWKLRQAYVGDGTKARLDAMRALWRVGKGERDRLAGHVLTARAATRIAPDAELQDDAPDLIAAMLAGGFDREAARWIPAIRRMDDSAADRCWAMLALAAPDPKDLGIGFGRIDAFASRDTSAGKQRSGLLVAGLAALGRIDRATAVRLDERHSLGLAARTRWSGYADGAAERRQPGTALLLTASGLQAPGARAIGAFYLLHSVRAVRATGLDFTARMIAAEALARS
jgi:hypothetical protein